MEEQQRGPKIEYSGTTDHLSTLGRTTKLIKLIPTVLQGSRGRGGEFYQLNITGCGSAEGL